MCLTLSTDKSEHTAQVDIPCWKILRERSDKKGKYLEALYWEHLYRLKEDNALVNIKPEGRHIEEGYHSFISLRYAQDHYKILRHKHTGYSNIILCEAVIPAGASYYIGSYEQDMVESSYCSSTIRIISRLEVE